MAQLTLKRGTNFSHWLQRSLDELLPMMRYDDFALVASWGADHVRLPFEHMLIQSDQPPFDLLPTGLDILDRAVAWAKQAGLSLILDLHTAAGMPFLTPEANAIWRDPVQQQRFTAIWRTLAERYRGQDHLAFELLNEPTADDPADWNHLARLGLDAVRGIDTERTVIIGSNSWNVPSTFPDLADFHDAHLVANVHWYEPFIFTHQHAPWADLMMLLDLKVDYPSQMPDLTAQANAMPTQLMKEQTLLFSNVRLDAVRMEACLQHMLAYRERTGIPLFCSEFGVYERAPMPSRIRWYQDTIALFNRHDIGWANWDFRGDFGVLDANGNKQPFHQTLFPD